METATKSGQLTVLLQSRIKKIDRQDVEIEHTGQRVKIKNDPAIVCDCGILPTAFLKSIGIEVETKYGTA